MLRLTVLNRIDFKVRTLQIDDKVIKLQIYVCIGKTKEIILTLQQDTAGQDRFRTITTAYVYQ